MERSKEELEALHQKALKRFFSPEALAEAKRKLDAMPPKEKEEYLKMVAHLQDKMQSSEG
ncbi:MAG: hypothetical protein U0V74_07360 [Chitinophagales bacterium]